MAFSNLKSLAYNILKITGESINRDTEIPEVPKCSICTEDILIVAYRAFTILECGHIFHRICIERKIMHTTPSTCPFSGCDKSVDVIDEGSRRDSTSSQISDTSTLVDEFTRNIEISSPRISSQDRDVGMGEKISSQDQDVDMDDREEGGEKEKEKESQFEIQSDSTGKKRTNEATDESTENSSSKKVKKVIKDEDSIVLKRLIRELSSDTTRISEIREKKGLHKESVRQVDGSRIFFDLYLKISKAEENSDNARHEVLRAYYFLGEELGRRLTDYKQSMEEHEAQKKVNDEVRDQLPKEVSKNALRKKTERARKVYDLFFRIGGDKVQRMAYIQRIKTFTAPSISNLSLENIKYVALQVRKNTRQT